MNQPHTIRLSSWARLVGLALLLGVGVLASLGLATSTAHAQPAATITVSTCDESHLDSAISSAASGDTITFGCSGTIALSQTLVISKDLTLDSSTRPVTLSGGDSTRVLYVNSGVTLTLNALIIAHGFAFFFDGGGGSGLYNNGGTVNITNSTFAYNSVNGLGGGILNHGGTVTITNSTFAYNSAGNGSGILNAYGGPYNNLAGKVTISNSTFAYNSDPVGSGGAIENDGGTVSISQSIVANNGGSNCANLADQGYNLSSDSSCGFTGTGSLQNTDPKLASTLVSNGGFTQTLALLDGSPAINKIPASVCTLSTDQRGFSRPQGPACDMGALEFRVPELILPKTMTVNASGPQGATVGYTVIAYEPDDASVRATVNCSPASGSTFAIGTTTVNCTASDHATPPDVSSGSFQVVVSDQPAPTSTVSTCDESHLDSAISSAASGDTITFGCSGTITLSQTLDISKNLTLDGSGQQVTLSGGGSVRVLQVTSGVSFTLNALTIAHGYSFNTGGGLFNFGTVTITNSTFANNSAGRGGGLDNEGSTVTITNSTFANNSAGRGGGGLLNSGAVSISNSTFANNSAPSGQDGGLENGGVVSISQSIVANNGGGGNCSAGGYIIDQGYNLESGTDCGFTNTGSLQNTDPRLDPSGLQNNGGPTQTIALQSNSPAIDHIPAAQCPATDQRGVSRLPGERCDIGAFEFPDTTAPTLHLPSPITVNATSSSGAVVSYTATATDDDGDALTPTCAPASGSTFPIDSTTVNCSASEPGSDTASGSFTVTVNDTDLGLTNLPANITTNATSPQGATVTYTPPTVVDEESPLPTANCTPASGSTFAIGTTTVTCTATDSDDSNSPVSHSFTVTVNDTDLGLTNLPATITTNATSPQGATVTYTPPTVVDEDSPLPPVNCTPASGSTFAIGTTTVNCTASDAANPPDTTTGSFQVVVQDTLPPTLQLPSSPITANATGPQGATVSYTVTATDPVYPSNQLTITCIPVSGSTFAIGTTTVNCSASDPAGNSSSGSFSVVVKDVTPPTLNVPSTITMDATSPSGASVTYTVTATDPDNAASDLTINCSPVSGSTFAIGTTTVNCSASDPAGNTASGNFSVVVNGTATQVSNLITTVNSFGLPADIQAGFDTQLQAVQADLAANNTPQACSDLTAFINHVQAQSGKHLTVSQANQLLAAAKQVQAVQGC